MGLSWGDLNPLSWPGQVGRRLEKDFGDGEKEKAKKDALNNQANQADAFRDYSTTSVGALGTELGGDRERMRRRAMGYDSLSSEQLRQGLQQQMSAQQAAAASAAPQNAVMASRNAMMNMGRAQAGLSGQMAMAGIAERMAAEKQLADMLLQQRQQDVNASLGSSQNAINALGGTGGPTGFQRFAGMAAQGLGTFSDERLKTEVDSGDADAKKALDTLSAHTYRYKDPKFGEGKQLGVMAQALERAGLKQAVIDTPLGKKLDTGKLTGANTAMLAALAKRVSKLEEK